MTAEQIHHIGIAHGKLVDRLTSARYQLRRLVVTEGGGFRDRLLRMNKLRDEIESLLKRIERAERLMEGA